MSKAQPAYACVHVLLANTSDDYLDEDKSLAALSRVIRDPKGLALTATELRNRCVFTDNEQYMDSTFRITPPADLKEFGKRLVSHLQPSTSVVIVKEGGYRAQFESFEHVGHNQKDIETMLQSFVLELKDNILESFGLEEAKKKV